LQCLYAFIVIAPSDFILIQLTIEEGIDDEFADKKLFTNELNKSR
jgi:hypothetical protein